MKLKLSKVVFIYLILTQSVLSYVHQRTSNGNKSTWPNSNNIFLKVNGSNSSGISSSTINSITSGVIGAWNLSEGPNIQAQAYSGAAKSNQSDLYFSNSSIFFSSSSVLAVTETIYNNNNGKIIEANIILKDSILYSSVPGSDYYVGDVISHEVGHFLGLDHATLPFSTMFYRLVRGQSTPSFDDILGVSRLYNPIASSGGTLSGKIAGSRSQISIFAAEVDLISSLDGRVVASVLTEQDGSFIFSGLPLNDVYYIYVKPPKVLDTLSPFYQTARTDFCTGFASYKGSFFETCNSARRGFPQGVPLNDSRRSIDIGLVTIRCDLKTPINYFIGRNQGNFDLALADRGGDSLSGFFTQAELTSNAEDVFTIDLSHVDTSSGNMFLDLSLISQDFQSKAAWGIEVQNSVFSVNYNDSLDSDLNPNLNVKGRVPLDSFNQANNVFTVRVTPKVFSDFLLTKTLSSETYYYPDFSKIGDDRIFYQLIYFVGQGSGSNYSVFKHYDYQDFRGNQFCMDAEKTYGVKSASAVSGVSGGQTVNAAEEAIIACGTIALVNDDDDGPKGPRNFLTLLLGLLLSSVMLLFKREGSA